MTRLQAIGLTSLRQGRATLVELDLQLAAGEMLGIIGPNGAGKSSLLRALAGLDPIAEGRILLDGLDLSHMARAARARQLGYHPQNPQIHWPIDVATLVALGRIPHTASLDRFTAADHQAIEDAVQLTALAPLLARRVDTLSGGELARAHIARLLAGQQTILLADEPIANLDPRFQIEILALLKARAQAGCAVAVVLHDLNLAARYCDRLLLLDRGRAQAHGRPVEVLTEAQLEQTFAVSGNYLTDRGIDRALSDNGSPASSRGLR